MAMQAIPALFAALDETLLSPLIAQTQYVLQKPTRRDLIQSIMNKDPSIPPRAGMALARWVKQRMVSCSEELPAASTIARLAHLYRECFCMEAMFALRPTVTYSGRPEFAVVATQHIQAGSLIPGLCGLLTPAQCDTNSNEEELERSMVSIGHGRSIARLSGPISRVNHDCVMFNAQFDIKKGDRLLGHTRVSLLSTKNIQPGEEITVHYGPNYFGPSNVECLCAGCEMQHRNGWSAVSQVIGSQLRRTRAATEEWKRATRNRRVYSYEAITLLPVPRKPGDYKQALNALSYERCIAPSCRMQFANLARDYLCVCCHEQVAARYRFEVARRRVCD